MKEYEDLLPIHAIVINLYKKFKKICDENKLRYFAISGTTIGAVLWGNIIPWDDDIDIAMPAEDYKKFLAICKKNKLPEGVGFIEYNWFGLQLYDKGTMLTNVYYLDDPKRFSGVSIDVVPLINIPNSKKEQELFVDNLKTFHEEEMLRDRYGILSKKGSKKEASKQKDDFLDAYKFGETDFVMDFSDDRYVLKAKGFINPIIVKFADTTIPVSSNYDDDLTIQYGKYQKYPPKEKRDSLHQELSIVDLNRSCDDYARVFEKSPEEMKKIIDIKHVYEGICEREIHVRDKHIAKLTKDYQGLLEENERLKEKLTILEEKICVKLKKKIRSKINSLRRKK